MTKIGAHVVYGNRNGFADFCAAKPAVVLAVNEGGALLEAKAHSPDTFTIFRDASVYIDAPHGMDQMSIEEAQQAAHDLFPQLTDVWSLNPADAYTVLNEPAGHDLDKIPVYIAFEQEMMSLAEQHGYRLCVLNLATGTPSLSVWEDYYLPHLARAAAGGHVYGRHAYAPNIFPPAGESGTSRPLVEADILSQRAIEIPLYITECGFGAGYEFVGIDTFVYQTTEYDKILNFHQGIAGVAYWSLGDYRNVNWQDAIPRMVEYMLSNADEPCNFARVPYDREYWVYPTTATEQQRLKIAELAALQQKTCGPSYDDAGIGCGLSSRIARLFGIAESDKNTFRDWYDSFYPGTTVIFEPMPDEETTPMSFSHWPTEYQYITQEFGDNPEYYSQFGLPGHEGVDIRAYRGSPVYAVASGIVYAVGDERLPESQGGHNYGVHVRVDHGNGYRTIYAHLNSRSVGIGEEVAGGQAIGESDDTGLSFGSHLHLTLKKDGATASGETTYPYDIVDPTPFLLPLLEQNVAFGLHATADSGYPPDQQAAFDAEVLAFQTADIEAIKLLSSTDPLLIAAIANATGARQYIVRAFLDFGDREVTPQQFFDWTFIDVGRTIDQINAVIDNAEIFLEIHNEPNLYAEGLGKSWLNGEDFSAWFLEVVALYKEALPSRTYYIPGVKYVYPGLSPGSSIPDVRMDARTFLLDSMAAVQTADLIGVHAYWSPIYPMAEALAWVETCASHGECYITEASNNGDAPPETKGAEYIEFWEQLQLRGNVKGVTYFISYASNPAFAGEQWVGTPIPSIVGLRSA